MRRDRLLQPGPPIVYEIRRWAAQIWHAQVAAVKCSTPTTVWRMRSVRWNKGFNRDPSPFSITLVQDRILASMSLVQRQGCVDLIGWVCQERTFRGGRSLVHSMQHFLSNIEADSTRRLHAAVRRHGAERNAKGFTSRGPLVAMRVLSVGLGQQPANYARHPPR